MVFLDNAATTSMDPEIITSLQDYMRVQFANSGTVYGIGIDAKNKIEEAKENIAFALGIPSSHNLVFTPSVVSSSSLGMSNSSYSGILPHLLINFFLFVFSASTCLFDFCN